MMLRLKETQLSVNVHEIIPPIVYVHMTKYPTNYWWLEDVNTFYKPNETLSRSGWVMTDRYSTKDAEKDIFDYDS